MGYDNDFYQMWRNIQGKREDDELPPCPIGHKFMSIMEELIFDPLSDGASLGQIAQAKYELQEEWHAWKNSVPRWHLLTCSTDHRCLDDVYEACFDRLHLMQLTHIGRRNLVHDYDELTKRVQLPQEKIDPIVVSPGIYLGKKK